MALLDFLAGLPGAPPPVQPQQPSDPNSLLSQLMGLGSVDMRHKLLQQQIEQGQQTAQGAPIDYTKGKGTPLLLAGLANLVSSGVGGYQQGKAMGGLRSLVGEQTAGRKAGVEMGSQWSPPDLTKVQTASDADLPGQMQAAQASTGAGRRLAMALSASGDPALAAIGKNIMAQSDESQQALQSMPQTRLQQAMEKLKLANEGPQEALGGMTPSTAKAKAELEGAEKPIVVPIGSSMVSRTGKPLSTGGGNDLISQTADGIMNGSSPPDMKGLGKMRVPVQAELAKRGFNLSQANLDWQATQKHLATLNSGGQERLNQAINFVSDTIPVIRQLYGEWQKQAGSSGYKVLNKATLATMKQLPGDAGSTAQALETQINDFVSELGTVYKGGGTSTDKSLGMAASNLSADWNPETFNKALDLAERNIAIRKNSVTQSGVHGASAGNQYAPTPAPAAAPAAPTPAPAAAPAVRKFTRGLDGKLVEAK